MQTTLRWLHRWAGLTVGFLFVVVGISGSLLLFQPQFFRWAHGDMIPAGLSERTAQVSQWYANAMAAAPQFGQPIVFWAPHVEHNASGAGMVVFLTPGPGGLGQTGFKAVVVAPETGKVLGIVDFDRSPAFAPLFLHSALWAGDTGRLILAVMAVGVTTMLLVGLYLWWPGRRKVLETLSPMPVRNLKYAVRLHRWLSGWIWIVLLTVTVSGLYLVRPAWIELALPGQPHTYGGAQSSSAPCEGGSMTLDEAIAKAQALAPGSTWTEIRAHDLTRRFWEINLRTGPSLAAHLETHTLVDLTCGTAALESIPKTRSGRELTEEWLTDLHSGSALGTSGEILVAASGLSTLVFIWSGLRIWLRGRRRRAD